MVWRFRRACIGYLHRGFSGTVIPAAGVSLSLVLYALDRSSTSLPSFSTNSRTANYLPTRNGCHPYWTNEVLDAFRNHAEVLIVDQPQYLGFHPFVPNERLWRPTSINVEHFQNYFEAGSSRIKEQDTHRRMKYNILEQIYKDNNRDSNIDVFWLSEEYLFGGKTKTMMSIGLVKIFLISVSRSSSARRLSVSQQLSGFHV